MQFNGIYLFLTGTPKQARIPTGDKNHKNANTKRDVNDNCLNHQQINNKANELKLLDILKDASLEDEDLTMIENEAQRDTMSMGRTKRQKVST